MVEIKDKSKCAGCTACANICPKSCINMKPDNEGFSYPIVDIDKCINCDFCEKVCPIVNSVNVNELQIAYVIQNKDADILANSTSGGFFAALCDYVIENRGYVVGAAYDKDFRVIHKVTSNLDDTRAFMGSKYVQSNLGDIFSKIKLLLEQKKIVVFSGTPCQVSGLKSYLQQDYNNLITVDLVCRSIPSPKLWWNYLEYQKSRCKSDIKSIRFRNKTYGYHSGSMVIKFSNGKVYAGSNRVDLYAKSFHEDVCSRPSCYDCRFKTRNRCSDYTIFDCWYPEQMIESFRDNDKGHSNLFIHSVNGLRIFESSLSKKFISFKVDVNKAISFTGGMVDNSIKRPNEREVFYKLLSDKGFLYATEKCISITKRDKIIEKLKMVLYKLKLLNLIKRIWK